MLPDGVPWQCEFCQGESRKPRASALSRRCTSNALPHRCRDALTSVRAAELAGRQAEKGALAKRARAALDEQGPAYAALIAIKECFAVKEVYGVSFVDLSIYERDEKALRVGVDEDAFEHCYLIRGGFGDDKSDALLPGTRWVKLRELLENVSSATQLSLLSEFDKSIEAKLVAARRLAQEELDEQQQIRFLLSRLHPCAPVLCSQTMLPSCRSLFSVVCRRAQPSALPCSH